PRDGFRIRIEKEFRAIEPQPALRIVRTGNAKTVQLPWSHNRQKYVPDLVGVVDDRNANIFFGSVNILEQAKLNRSGRFGKKGKVDAVAQPRRAQGIWITEPGPYRSHKRAAHLCGMERALAITNVKSRKQNKERRLPSRRVCNLLQCGDPAMAGPLSKREHLRALHLTTATTVRKPAFPPIAFPADSLKLHDVIRKITLSFVVICALALAVYFCAHHDWHPLPLGTKIDRIVVEKAARKLLIFRDGRRLKTYRVALGRSPIGPKEMEGDIKTPEGIYKIDGRNAQSSFHLALHISYPSDNDNTRAAERGVSAGFDIMIHGIRNGLGWMGAWHRWKDWTVGCIALTDEEIE